jgi:hypothetical protein
MKSLFLGLFSYLIIFNINAESTFKYQTYLNRDEIFELLKKESPKRVLDIGYSASMWSKDFVTHYIDIRPAADDSKNCFIGDVTSPEVWELVKEDVEKNGPFDFCICSHTLEDIIHPVFVANMINKFCKAGFIAVPSKFLEMNRFEGQYRGYIHHRYVYNHENGVLVGYPKLNFMDFDSRFDLIANQLNQSNVELQLFWKDSFELKIINNNYMGPCVGSVLKYYDGLLKN